MSDEDTAELVRVSSPIFIAGLVIRNGVVSRAAPILHWTIGMTRAEVRAAIARRGMRATTSRILPETGDPDAPIHAVNFI